MFNRSFGRNEPPPPQPSRPQQRSQYPPGQAPSRHDDPRMANGQREPPNYSRKSGGGPPARVMQMKLHKHSDNAYVFGNLCAASQQDIPRNRDGTDPYILVNNRFVFTARPLPNFPPGHISLSDPQRTFTQISLTDEVLVQAYDPSSDGGVAYLASMDLEVGFMSRTKNTEVPYDQDELAQHAIKNFENQIWAPGQQLVMDHKSIPLKLTVRTVQLGDLSMEKASSSAPTQSDPLARGILVRNTQINFFKEQRSTINLRASNRRPAANAIVQPDFKFETMGIGGLDREFSTIFRRAFASRIFPPGLVEQMNIQHVKGILLHGPPGTGKTLIARQIGKMLNAREPKVINGPEVLNKYVGQSEENIRKLFADAEKESKEKGAESGLHIIIFDELDAVCKQRGSGAAGGTGVGDSVVNQLLSKLDGVDQLNNILLIGMTNRMDMIDDALLRPGRLELHIEISLPDEAGRVQILKIHTNKMLVNGRMDEDVDVIELASLTKNFSGAEISGLVRAASSFAFQRHTKVGTMASVSEDVENMRVNRDDFMHALEEVHSAFGVSEEQLEDCVDGGLLRYSPTITSILEQGSDYVGEIREDPSNSLLSVLFHGPSASGKTALAARIALDSAFPFIKLISPSDMPGFNEMAKVSHLNKIFADAYKSSLSVLLIDNIERIIDWSPIGPRFSNAVVGTLATRLAQKPPKGRRLLVMATTSRLSALQQLDFLDAFNHKIAVPNVGSQEELYRVLDMAGAFGGERGELKRAVGTLEEMTGRREVGVGIKNVLDALRTSRRAKEGEQVNRFVAEMEQAVLERMSAGGA
ncbi:MAG: transport between ER and Golgi ATPase protein [Chrysothrix sp. TS-e1954]|nr:MAG: transport between ER and Golgi ATPase protein [Chrysothrix sp. TS-e1954]